MRNASGIRDVRYESSITATTKVQSNSNNDFTTNNQLAPEKKLEKLNNL